MSSKLKFVDIKNPLVASEIDNLFEATMIFTEFMGFSQLESECFDKEAFKCFDTRRLNLDDDAVFKVMYDSTHPYIVKGERLVLNFGCAPDGEETLFIHFLKDGVNSVQVEDLGSDKAIFKLGKSVLDYFYTRCGGRREDVFHELKRAVKALQRKRIQLEKSKGLRGFFL